ncbi:MAG TPA: hypothetical protein VGH24_05645 [Solirubrobacteraceae bacterium]
MNVPDAAVTDALFKPKPDGLGLNPETFFDRAFTDTSLRQYPLSRNSPTGWCYRWYRDVDYQRVCNS